MTTRRRTTEARRAKSSSLRAAQLIVRSDPAIPPIGKAEQRRMARTDDPVRYRQLTRLNDASPDTDTFWSVLAVEAAFFRHSGAPSLSVADDADVARFITEAAEPHAQLLRRTALVACSLALADIGQDRTDRPQTLVDPPQLVYRSQKRSHAREAEQGTIAPAQQRAATNDEILAIRLAVPLAPHTHPTAVGVNVAIANSGATQPEVPQVVVRNISTTHKSIKLPGRHTHKPDSPHFLPSRWVDLDGWSHQQIKNASEHLQGKPSASLGYRGAQAVTAQAARTYCGKAVDDAIKVAGLHGVWGLSIGSLSLWRLTYTALHDGLGAAATRYGAHTQHTVDKLIRQLHAAE